MPSFLFDLDGTLIDSVYQHVIAWRAALEDIGIDLSVWRIHRRIGMSGGLFVQALLRETGRTLSPDDIAQLQQAHAVEYRKQMASVTALPGARELLAALTGAGVQWAIATSGYALTARPALELLGLPEDTPMVTRDLVRHAKPDPDLFLAAAALLGVEPRNAMVVGDSVLGPAGRAAGRRARHRAAIGRVWPRGTRAGRRLPRLRRPGRDAVAPVRDRRPAGRELGRVSAALSMRFAGVCTVGGVLPDHPLARLIDTAADGRFPAADGEWRRVPPWHLRLEAIIAFTGHAVFAVQPDITGHLLASLGADGFGGAHDPG